VAVWIKEGNAFVVTDHAHGLARNRRRVDSSNFWPLEDNFSAQIPVSVERDGQVITAF
jgi:hypothetical protein